MVNFILYKRLVSCVPARLTFYLLRYFFVYYCQFVHTLDSQVTFSLAGSVKIRGHNLFLNCTSGHIMLRLSCALPQEVGLNHLMSTTSGRFYSDHQFEFDVNMGRRIWNSCPSFSRSSVDLTLRNVSIHCLPMVHRLVHIQFSAFCFHILPDLYFSVNCGRYFPLNTIVCLI